MKRAALSTGNVTQATCVTNWTHEITPDTRKRENRAQYQCPFRFGRLATSFGATVRVEVGLHFGRRLGRAYLARIRNYPFAIRASPSGKHRTLKPHQHEKD